MTIFTKIAWSIKAVFFFDELEQELLANNIKVKFYEHDLLMELKGKISNINFK